MNRREFLQRIGAASVMGGMPLVCHPAQASTVDHYWIMMSATGGWDPTIFCDPKGSHRRRDGNGPVTHVNLERHRPLKKQGGNIVLAPFSRQLPTEQMHGELILEQFLEQHTQKTLLINGIDTGTNSHEIGARTVWSGFSKAGSPCFAAMVAGVKAPELPLSFITSGGYDAAGEFVAPARGANQKESFLRLTEFNRVYEGWDLLDEQYFHQQGGVDVYALIREAELKRLKRQQQQASLLKERNLMNRLLRVRDADANLSAWAKTLSILERAENIRQKPSIDFGTEKANDLALSMINQINIVAAALGAGLAVSANLSANAFDSHSYHDHQHYASLSAFVDSLNYLWEALALMGVADKTTVIVGSDFGRTPYYNNDEGKDHWPVTSMMLMGKGIRGNRTVGITDENFEAQSVHPNTLRQSAQGEKITPAHIHENLRRLANINTQAMVQRYPLLINPMQLI